MRSTETGVGNRPRRDVPNAAQSAAGHASGRLAAPAAPDAVSFAAAHRLGRSVPLSLEIDAPLWEPLDLIAALPAETTAYALETPGGPADLSRRSFVAWDPSHELILRQGWLETRSAGRRTRRQRCTDPIESLRRFLAARGAHARPDASGFCGGLIGYIAYDFKNHLERLPDTVDNDLGTPDLRLGFVRRVVAWDHRARRVRLTVNLRCASARAQDDYARARAALQAFHDECVVLAERSRRAGAVDATKPMGPGAAQLRSNLTRASYDRMLARTREHILAGDIYQANISHRFETPFTASGLALYRYLRAINPSPFAAYMRFPDHEVVSCSPERLVRLAAARVETRPIAGTRPRGPSPASDRRLRHELLASDKERAEHLMIVDMARNDIGRVCELGSVSVESFMAVERYSHVHHLVSNVVGRLKQRHDAFDLLAATFPGASITGVPKVRCMEIIDSLEPVRRGLYTGSAGYFGLDGDCDLNILIRTFFLQSGRAFFSVGGGIVADSDTDHEYAETLAKGQALQESLHAVLTPPPVRSTRTETRRGRPRVRLAREGA